jgi:site-specific recombinase XerC
MLPTQAFTEVRLCHLYWRIYGGGNGSACRKTGPSNGTRNLCSRCSSFTTSVAGGVLGARLTPHCLRHTVAASMMQNGADLCKVAGLPGHDARNVTAEL